MVDFGKENFRALSTMPSETQEEVWKSWEQWTRFLERDAASNYGQGVVVIIDFDGFTLANYAFRPGYLWLQAAFLNAN